MNRFFILIFTCIVLLLPPIVTQAHSEGIAQLIAVELDNCLVSVWTWPDPLLTGREVHIAALLAEKTEPGTTGAIILNSAVKVTFTPLAEGRVVTAPATHEQADVKFFYETKVRLREAGMYDITVDVQDDTWGCHGQVGFSLPVVAGLGVSWAVWVGAGAGVAALVGLGLWQRGRRRKDE
ncbi:MAG: hypothetical protein KJ063_11355 [Anaerolineae bacterium]|nr:hypothetical protein [Anaerolineae bacterium]